MWFWTEIMKIPFRIGCQIEVLVVFSLRILPLLSWWKPRWGPLGVNEYLGRGIFKKPGSTARISVFSKGYGESLPLEIVEVNGGYWWILVDIGGSWRIRPSFNINTLQEFGIPNSSRGWGTTVPKRHVMYDGCLKIGDIDGYQIPYFVVIEWGTWFLKHGNWAFRILSGWCLVLSCWERAVSEFQ